MAEISLFHPKACATGIQRGGHTHTVSGGGALTIKILLGGESQAEGSRRAIPLTLMHAATVSSPLRTVSRKHKRYMHSSLGRYFHLPEQQKHEVSSDMALKVVSFLLSFFLLYFKNSISFYDYRKRRLI